MKDVIFPITYKTDDRGIRDSERALERLGKVVAGIGQTAAVAAGAAGVGLLINTMTRGFDRLQAIENATNKLEGLGHSAFEVEEIMDSALAAVKGTAYGLGDAATIAASAVAAGVKPGQQLTKYLTLTADAASIAGVSLEDMGRTMNNVRALGAAYNDTLQILAEKGIPIYTMLAEEMGVTTEEVKKLASEGKISGDIFESAMEKKFGGAALKAGETVQGAFANLEAALGRLGAALLGTTYEELPQFLNDLTDSIDALAADPEFVAFVEQMGEQFTNLLPVLQGTVEELMQLGLDLLPVLAEALPIVTDLFGLGAEALEVLTGAADGSNTILSDLFEVLGLVTFYADTALGAINALGDALPAQAQPFADYLGYLNPVTGQLQYLADTAEFSRINLELLRDAISGSEISRARYLEWLKNIPVFGQLAQDYLWRLNPSVTSPGGRPKTPGMAKGGVVAMEGFSWVGEKGPELLSLPKGATVTPIPQHMRADQMMGANSGGGPNVTYAINVNAGMGTNGTQVGQEIIKAISQFERGNGRVFARA